MLVSQRFSPGFPISLLLASKAAGHFGAATVNEQAKDNARVPGLLTGYKRGYGTTQIAR